ncbi:hypothetical protein J3A83DRAFT_4185729 [Scleroderma citrinum]
MTRLCMIGFKYPHPIVTNIFNMLNTKSSFEEVKLFYCSSELPSSVAVPNGLIPIKSRDYNSSVHFIQGRSDFTTAMQDTSGANAFYSNFQDHLSGFTLMHNTFSIENIDTLYHFSESSALFQNMQDIPNATAFHANFNNHLSTFHPTHNTFLLENLDFQQPNPPPAGDANLQSTPADMLSMFQVCMDTAINSIPSDIPLLVVLADGVPNWRQLVTHLGVKAWLLLCQEQLTPQSHNYWKVEIKHLYIEYLAYPTIFHSVYVMILKKGTNHEIIMALHNEAFVGLIIDMPQKNTSLESTLRNFESCIDGIWECGVFGWSLLGHEVKKNSQCTVENRIVQAYG